MEVNLSRSDGGIKNVEQLVNVSKNMVY